MAKETYLYLCCHLLELLWHTIQWYMLLANVRTFSWHFKSGRLKASSFVSHAKCDTAYKGVLGGAAANM